MSPKLGTRSAGSRRLSPVGPLIFRQLLLAVMTTEQMFLGSALVGLCSAMTHRRAAHMGWLYQLAGWMTFQRLK